MSDRDVVARLETMLVSQMRRNEVTCPGEHEYEPYCTHGNDHDPVVVGLRAALVDVCALVERCEQAEQERDTWKGRATVAGQQLQQLHGEVDAAIKERDQLKADLTRVGELLVGEVHERDRLLAENEWLTKNRDECAAVFAIDRKHEIDGPQRECGCPSCNLHHVYQARHEQDIEAAWRDGFIAGDNVDGPHLDEALVRFRKEHK